MEKLQDSACEYLSGVCPVWCPGCGYYGILSSLIEAFAELGVPSHELALVSGIGCASRLPYFVKAYGFHGIHGRALPIAQGVKLANPKLTVVVVGGDGDGLAIGGGHLPHAARNNVDFTYLLFNNAIYGMTKGQFSPTTMLSAVTKTSPFGLPGETVNPAALAIVYGASFVARGFSVKKEHLKNLILEGIRHRGFSFIEILASCASFNTTDMNVARIIKAMASVPSDHDPAKPLEALRLATHEEKIYLGVLHRAERPTLEDRCSEIQRAARARGGGAYADLVAQFA
ncbi:MAG TPA: thiamine pyrophosphate-dependent enzyme [candidate division Zixibacteria bacterium]|nr:thiamine pyrophosphate-dependent enzyme [candidate division Zixibacteria bacterium]